jgi:mRNA interferase HigB
VHVISRKKLKEAALIHRDAEAALQAWFKVAESATWQSLNEVRKTYASADSVGKFTVFNIKGNKYRLIVKIEYTYQKIFIKHVLTHAEYDKEEWKQ